MKPSLFMILGLLLLIMIFACDEKHEFIATILSILGLTFIIVGTVKWVKENGK